MRLTSGRVSRFSNAVTGGHVRTSNAPAVRSDDATHPVWEASLDGTSIRFVVIDGQLAHRFEGEVAGKSMYGVVRTGVGSAEVETPFQAVRIGDP